MSEQSDAKRTCRGCRFFFEFPATPQLPAQPQCHRNPPTAAFVPGGGMFAPGWVSSYPPINPDYPCGEYRGSADQPSVLAFPKVES
jgi:hypothetical protein